MKSFKDFSTKKQEVPEQTVEVSLPEEYEVFDEPPFELTEKDGRQKHNQPHDPPPILIMRRKAIRTYPNNHRVALYYIDKLNKYVTIPYSSLEWSAMPEQYEYVEENVMHHLQSIVDRHSAKPIKFKDGTSMKVDPTTAHAVLKVHGALNSDNKKKVEDMVHKSKHHFGKVVDFAWKQLK
jgi:hypothetical protein